MTYERLPEASRPNIQMQETGWEISSISPLYTGEDWRRTR
jgi:hypothetical protein